MAQFEVRRYEAAAGGSSVAGRVLKYARCSQPLLTGSPSAADRDEGGATVMKHAHHMLTRTYGARGAIAKVADAGRSFREIVADDLWDMRRIGEQQYGDPSYFNQGI